jgi:hypothetical protein
MHSPHTPSEKQSSRSEALTMRTLTAVIAIGIASCISPQTRPVSALSEPTIEMAEGDIDNPIFVALIGISAEIQA